MKERESVFLASLVFLIAILGMLLPADGYIRKSYTIKNIVDECTNVLIGTVTEVNPGRMTAKVRVEEDLKGTSRFKQIQMRLDVGQGRHPQKLMRLLEQGQPIIVFYAQKGDSIQSLAHVSGTWFQTMARDRTDKSKVWWGLTHIEIYLNGSKTSKRTSTLNFQKELRALLSQETVQLLFLKTQKLQAESLALSKLKSVGNRQVGYQEITIPNLHTITQFASLDNTRSEILWVEYQTLSSSQDRSSDNQEKLIKIFVENGGVVIVSGKDRTIFESFLGTERIPKPLYDVATPVNSTYQLTLQAVPLFEKPNLIQASKVVTNGERLSVNDKFEILVTTNGGKEIVVAILKYGRGIFLIANLRNSPASDISQTHLFLENLIDFACEFLSERQPTKH